uniref:TROVE domain-containing protein n=1 Tax=Acrobeloides nanus TaxID=290746 RepID=A0A914ENZ0_9BILA
MFVQFCEVVSNAFSIKSQNKGSTGWSRMMRKSIAAWYLEREPKQLVYHITKYRQREGWSHRDLLRLCHPDVSNKGDDALVYDQIFHYVVHGETSPIKRKFPQETTDEPAAKKSRKNYELTQTMLEKETTSEALKLLDAFVSIKHLTQSHHDKRVAQAIREHGLVREHISTELLNSPAVWIALLENMPLTALIRNLAKLSSLKIIREENKGYQYQQQDDLVISKITDEKHLKAARVHPLTILLALSTYRQGHGIQGHLEWKTNSKIVEALEKAFLLSFHNVEPTGKRILLAYDVSASMTETILGTHLSCREAAAALGMCFLKTEPKVECMAFSQKFDKLPFDKDWDLMKMVDYVKCMKFGFTNCALPMIWAADNKKDFDVFIVFTDSETFHGKVKPFEALQQYRKAMNIPDAKLIVVGMTSTKFTIADPTDPGMLDVVGFDSAVPELIRNFVMGQI